MEHAQHRSRSAVRTVSELIYAIYLDSFACRPERRDGAASAPRLHPRVAPDEAEVAAALARRDAWEGRPRASLGELILEVIRALDERRGALRAGAALAHRLGALSGGGR
jgi:hypothetical protein